jgi:hypothetical protein
MPQLDTITFLSQIVCLFCFYFYLYLKFLKNVIGTTIAVLTLRKYYLYQQYATAMVHIFNHKKMKKQVAVFFGRYIQLLQQLSITSYSKVQHQIGNEHVAIPENLDNLDFNIKLLKQNVHTLEDTISKSINGMTAEYSQINKNEK